MADRRHVERLQFEDTSIALAADGSALRQKYAFVLARDFTLSALSLFVDTLRLAGDESDRSRRIVFDWDIIGERGLPIRSSCGFELLPTKDPDDPSAYDNVIVVGGLLGRGVPNATREFLLAAGRSHVPLTGLCTGSFILAECGLLDGYEASISWFHIKDFRTSFPQVRARARTLFTVDRDRSTCAGGAGAADLASFFVSRTLGSKAAEKASKILILERVRNGRDLQPAGDMFPGAASRIVKGALLLMESNLQHKTPVRQIAQQVGCSRRQLERLFAAELNTSPLTAYQQLRLRYASHLLANSDLPVSEVGYSCGFESPSHFSRAFREHYGQTPVKVRRAQPRG